MCSNGVPMGAEEWVDATARSGLSRQAAWHRPECTWPCDGNPGDPRPGRGGDLHLSADRLHRARPELHAVVQAIVGPKRLNSACGAAEPLARTSRCQSKWRCTRSGNETDAPHPLARLLPLAMSTSGATASVIAPTSSSDRAASRDLPPRGYAFQALVKPQWTFCR